MANKCPLCGKNKSSKQDLINHLESDHANELPDDMSTAQFIYYKIHGRKYGLCRICGKPTEWNEKTGKPMQICNSQACKDKVKEIAQQRMLKVYGKTSLMKDLKHQEKMLANRKISGVYVWSDHVHKFTYTGSYEKFAIEWLDKVMDLNPEHIQMPGPVLPYEFNGEIKYWITDIYLEDFNLIIEIKAGKDENTHPGFEHNRELEAAKDLSMTKQNQYNYTKITHKDMMKLITVLNMIRNKNLESSLSDEKDKEPVIVVNESIDSSEEMLSHLTNSDISSICESIFNEYTMSVANLSHITTNPVLIDKEKTDSADTLIDRLKRIKENTITKVNKEDAENTQTSIFSDRHQMDTPDPLVASNNFISNEDIIVDMETDPYNTKPNDFAEIGQSTIKSNFTVSN